MFKRLFLTAFGLAALTCTASAVNAQPAASGGQTFYVSTSLSDSVGRAADPTIYNIGGNTYFKLRDLGRLGLGGAQDLVDLPLRIVLHALGNPFNSVHGRSLLRR